MENLQIVLDLIKSLVTVIPFAVAFVIALVNAVKKAQSEKNWRPLIKMALNFIAEAETLFDKGADKKAWVMDMTRAAADEINFDIDDEALSLLIDNIVELTKNVNI